MKKSYRVLSAVGVAFLGCSSIAYADNDAELQKRIEYLESSLSQLKDQVAQKAAPLPAATVCAPCQPETGLWLGGRIRLQGYYDAQYKGGSFGLNPSDMPLKRISSNYYNRGHFNMSPSGSRLKVEAKDTIQAYATHLFVDVDFNGRGNGDSTNTSYTPRLRQGYVQIDKLFWDKTSLLVGQTFSTFQNMDAFTDVLDNLYGGFRQPMVRVIHPLTSCIKLSIALEKPNSEYTDHTGTKSDDADFGKSKVPDLTAQLRAEHGAGHMAVSAVVRRVQAYVRAGDSNSTVNFRANRTAWGLGISGAYDMDCKFVTWVWQINGGKGIGRYIDDCYNQDFYLQFPTTANRGYRKVMRLITAMNYIAGLKVKWANDLESNFGVSLTHFSKLNMAAVEVPEYNKFQQRYHVNLIYKALDNVTTGVEFMHYQRRAGIRHHNHGDDSRILLSFTYNFDYKVR